MSLNPNSRRALAWDRAYDQVREDMWSEGRVCGECTLGALCAFCLEATRRAEELMAEWAAADADGHPDA